MYEMYPNSWNDEASNLASTPVERREIAQPRRRARVEHDVTPPARKFADDAELLAS